MYLSPKKKRTTSNYLHQWIKVHVRHPTNWHKSLAKDITTIKFIRFSKVK